LAGRFFTLPGNRATAARRAQHEEFFMTTLTTLAAPSPHEPPSLEILKRQFLTSMQMRNCSPRTIESWEFRLRRFGAWCTERGIESLDDVTPELLAAYRRWLFHYRTARTGAPLRFATQAAYLIPLCRWCAWLAEQEWLPENPAADLQLPKEEKRLPAAVLTAAEVERVLNETDVTRPVGLRDRALLETLYSTGVRVGELVALAVYDLEPDRRIITVRQGKGRKDRVVPIGRRALSWLTKYLVDVRPQLVEKSNEATLFVTSSGRPFGRTHVSAVVRRYILKAGIAKPGSCHLMRHTAATLMLEAGADLRALQLFLGHSKLNTTQIYTHVSIQRLSEVHERTHPARPNGEQRDKAGRHDPPSAE
jgi:integrase/recombinase XerD